MGIHIFPHEDSAFGVCPLAIIKFDRYLGLLCLKPTTHVACRVSNLVATKIIQGLSHARMSHLVFQED